MLLTLDVQNSIIHAHVQVQFSISLFIFSSELGTLVVESELLEADAVVAAADVLLDFLVPNVLAVSPL